VLELQHHDGEPGIGHAWPAAVRKPPFTYLLGLDARRWLAFERSYGQVTDVDVQLLRGTTTVRFASPVGFRAGGTALVRLSGPLLDGLPRHPAVAERIIKVGTWRDGALQITAQAVSDYQFEMHVPELAEMTAALETHEEAPRFGLIHPALPLFDLAAECYPDEHRNLDSTRSKNFHAGRYMASDHATYSPASTTMESSGRRSRANGRAYGGATRYPLQRLLARDRPTIR
jgi:hypothetical protein